MNIPGENPPTLAEAVSEFWNQLDYNAKILFLLNGFGSHVLDIRDQKTNMAVQNVLKLVNERNLENRIIWMIVNSLAEMRELSDYKWEDLRRLLYTRALDDPSINQLKFVENEELG